MISSHSGVVQYVEGRAFLGDKPIEPKFGKFPDIKENQEFRTEDGRAEILLTPGVFLRLGENSSIRMLSTRLTDTRVEVLSGSAMIESNEIPKDNAIQLVYKKDASPSRRNRVCIARRHRAGALPGVRRRSRGHRSFRTIDAA